MTTSVCNNSYYYSILFLLFISSLPSYVHTFSSASSVTLLSLKTHLGFHSIGSTSTSVNANANANAEVRGLIQMRKDDDYSRSQEKEENEKRMFQEEKNKEAIIELYLQRIGFSNEEIKSFITEKKKLSLNNLQLLLSAHLCYVPFENMDLHTHPEGGQEEQRDDVHDVPQIKRKVELPSLDVTKSLRKIIQLNRGGFCYEVNLSFCWLLRSLGYEARLVVADVSCKQEIPAHVVILVDGLKYGENRDDKDGNIPILVDVGFGCPGVCDVLLPLSYDKIYSDPHDDLFRFDKNQYDFPLHKDRFDSVLYRRRVNVDAEGSEEPMYRFHSEDDLDYDAPEFQKGLEYVLTKSATFNEKRLCVISTENGHITLGSDYVKWVEKWETTKQLTLPTEKDWRSALFNYFGVKLIDEH
jgi:N-hydroxyarylamine O-acetyltransferase